MLPSGHIYLTSDGPVSDAHETTHGVNSRIRQEYGGAGAVNAFFVGRDFRAFVVAEPRIPLALVGRFVPAELRGVSFQLYLVQQAQQWNNQPLYLLDEWTAYANGAEVGLDLAANGSGRAEPYELQQAIEFCGYATALLLAVERHDQAYPDKAKLVEFIAWQCERVAILCDRAKKMPGAWSMGCEAALGAFEKRWVKK